MPDDDDDISEWMSKYRNESAEKKNTPENNKKNGQINKSINSK